MRDIKFRGKITQSFTGLGLKQGDWVYGSLIDDRGTTGRVYISWHNEGAKVSTTTEVDPESVGELWYSIHGMDIYEGDITNYRVPMVINHISVVEYGDNRLEYRLVKNLQPINDGIVSLGAIGNIHDNPELLKTE